MNETNFIDTIEKYEYRNSEERFNSLFRYNDMITKALLNFEVCIYL